jgi:hypothetical protein
MAFPPNRCSTRRFALETISYVYVCTVRIEGFGVSDPMNFRTDLSVRVIIITVAFSILSYIVIHNDLLTPDRLELAIPALFILNGIVILISVLFDIYRYHIVSNKNQSTS